MTTYKPRNDFVLIRVVDKGQTIKGVALPSSSLEGKENIVEAMGPEVKELCLGDKVLLIGTLKEDYAFLPQERDLLVIKQANVVLVKGNIKDDE